MMKWISILVILLLLLAGRLLLIGLFMLVLVLRSK